MLGIAKQSDLMSIEESQSIINMQILEKLEKLEKDYAVLLEKNPPSTVEFANRVADLEVKMAKLWALLIDYTPKNQEKLSKFGKRFGGKSKDF